MSITTEYFQMLILKNNKILKNHHYSPIMENLVGISSIHLPDLIFYYVYLSLH